MILDIMTDLWEELITEDDPNCREVIHCPICPVEMTLDSMADMQLLGHLEKAHGVFLSEKILSRMKTVADLRKRIEKEMARKN